MSFTKTIKALWRMYQLFVRDMPPVVLPPKYWTEGDAKAYSSFLETATGRKIRQIRFNNIYRLQIEAISDKDPYKNGVAFGVRAYSVREDSLLEISPEESASPQSTDQEEGLFQSVNR